MSDIRTQLEYREKLWNEGETEIYLSKDETNSFFEIMVHFLIEEKENYKKCLEDGIDVKNHILNDLVNVINGLPQELKEDLYGYEGETLCWNKELGTLEVV